MMSTSSLGLEHMKMNIKRTYQPDTNKYHKKNGKGHICRIYNDGQ